MSPSYGETREIARDVSRDISRDGPRDLSRDISRDIMHYPGEYLFRNDEITSLLMWI